MAGWHLDTKMAQDIVARTMRIIDTNINVMDARGRIIGSGDRERIGELHEGALLVLSQGRVVDIDDAVARHLHGVRQGINLPLRLEGEIVGVIGLTGEPENLRKYGELVCMTAEMMLEQSRLIEIDPQPLRPFSKCGSILLCLNQVHHQFFPQTAILRQQVHQPRLFQHHFSRHNSK